MNKKKTKKKRILKHFVLGLLIGLPILLIVLLSWPIATTFNVSVQTELVEYEVTDVVNSKIPFHNASKYNFNVDSLGVFDGDFKVSVGATVKIERIAFGPLSVQIKGKGNESAGAYYSSDTDLKVDNAPNFIEFVLNDVSKDANEGFTHIIPINGKVTLGRNISYETHSNSTALLRQGTVVVIGKSLFSNNYYKSSSYDLNIGDEFMIIEPKSKAYGFATVNENSGLIVAYKVIGKEGRILTPGPRNINSGYPVSLSFLSKIQNDAFFKGISLCIALLISIATIVPFLSGYYK